MDELKNMFTNNSKKKPQLKQVWEFSDIEKQNLLLATAAFTLALGFMSVRGFWGINELGITEWVIMVLLSMPVMLLAVGPAFILHEIGHKIVAKRNGCWAEFRADPGGLRFGILLAFFIGILFMAPGAVMVSGLVTRRENGHIAVAGPLTNLSLFLIGIPVWILIIGLTGALNSNPPSMFDGELTSVYLDGTSIVWQAMIVDAGAVWLGANLVLGLFNMIPFGPLDGLKVKNWSEDVFYAVFLIFLIPVVAWVLLGFWSPIRLLEFGVGLIF
tara:strand:+ start:385 stop:1200 length:816 start_codon:yes stop_codon:yes gene_type:complete